MTAEEAPSFALQLGSTALALVFVLALAWLALRALKRWQIKTGTAAGSDAVQVLASVSLSARERLVTVRWRGREYLLGVAAGSVQRIDDVAAGEDPPRL
jgi:flagellar protein FliO/FliZ